MLKKLSLKNTIVLTILIACNSFATANATVTGTHIMNFDNTAENPTFLQLGTTLFGPLDLTPAITVPDVNDSILQDGIRTASIGIGSLAPLDLLGAGHLHYAGNSTDITRAMAFEGDTGGASIFADDGSFSLQSIFFASMNVDVRVTGYKTGGGSISTLISTTSAASSIDFLALDSGFGDVTLVEMWQDSTGRGLAGTAGASTIYDDIMIAAPAVAAVPVPAAFYLFGTGLIGLLSKNNRKA